MSERKKKKKLAQGSVKIDWETAGATKMMKKGSGLGNNATTVSLFWPEWFCVRVPRPFVLFVLHNMSFPPDVKPVRRTPW